MPKDLLYQGVQNGVPTVALVSEPARAAGKPLVVGVTVGTCDCCGSEVTGP